MWNRRTIAVMASVLAVVLQPGWACGPEFPDTLIGATDVNLLAAPRADIVVEFQRIAPANPTAFKAIIPNDYKGQYGVEQTNDVDVADLTAALQTADIGNDARQAVIAALAAWRKAGEQGKIPAGLPEEFAAYERGAAKYHAHDFPAARVQWNTLLALPEKERHWRTVWATYMIARTYSDSDPAKAAGLFAQVRALAKQGFADSLGLTVASLGWEAKARWAMKEFPAALELYLEQMQAGDIWAPWSLRDCAAELLAGDDVNLRAAARDSISRQIITAYLIAHGGPVAGHRDDDWFKRSKRWMQIITDENVIEMTGADRLAWVAYQSDDMAGAERWLMLGGAQGEGTAVGQWIRAKLAMRAGKMDEAMTALINAAAVFPKNEEWNAAADGSYADLPWKPVDHASGELALLKLGRGQFVESLDLLLRGGFWADAAYVAERVLTVDELKTYVDKTWPDAAAPNPADAPDSADDRPMPPPERIRYLLARRLARLGRLADARPYYPAKWLPPFDQYVAALATGHDVTRPPDQRAAALWEAAKIARHQGIELLGTELAPDDAIWEGEYDLGSETQKRLQQATQPAVRTLSPVSLDEQKRLALPLEELDQRWQYRYVALDLAWSAAALMPNETDALAKLLIEAGQWVAARDPKAADRFYKALVLRCGTTDLGKEAARVKWFPKPKPLVP